MVPSEGSSLSSGFSASRNCDANTYNTSSATNGNTPRAREVPRPGCWLISRRMAKRRYGSKLAVGRHLHVAGVEAQLQIRLVAERHCAREFDAHHVDALRALT